MSDKQIFVMEHPSGRWAVVCAFRDDPVPPPLEGGWTTGRGAPIYAETLSDALNKIVPGYTVHGAHPVTVIEQPLRSATEWCEVCHRPRSECRPQLVREYLDGRETTPSRGD